MQPARPRSRKGIVAASALAKVMSGDMGDMKLAVGPAAYDPVTKTLYLPGIPTDDLPEDVLRKLRTYLGHEAAERGLSTWQPREYMTRPGLKWLINAINDARIDQLQGAKFPGYKLNNRATVQEDHDGFRQKVREGDETACKPTVGRMALLMRYVAAGIATYDSVYRDFPHMQPYLDAIESEARNLDLSSEARVIEQAEVIYQKLREKAEELAQQQADDDEDDTEQDVSGGIPIDESLDPKDKPRKVKGKPDADEEQEDEDGEGESSDDGVEDDDAESQGGGESDEPEDDEESGGGAGPGDDEDEESDEGEGDAEGSGDGKSDDESEDGEEPEASGDADGDEDADDDDVDDEDADDGDGESGLDSDREAGDGDAGEADGESSGDSDEPGEDAEEESAEHESDQQFGSLDGAPKGEDLLPDEAPDEQTIEQKLLDEVVKAMGLSPESTGAHTQYTYDNSRDQIEHEEIGQRGGWPLPPSEYRRAAEVTATRMRQVLYAPSRVIVRGVERGEVDERQIAALATGQERVLQMRRRLPSVSTAVSVSWDESGSMAGANIGIVKQLAYTLNEALGRLDVPTELLGWTTADWYGNGTPNRAVYRSAPLRHRIYKSFEDRWNAKPVLDRLAAISDYGSTPMGEGLLFAAERLSRHEADRKILFFMTDGAPGVGCAGAYDVHEDFIRKTAERCEAAGITLVAFGIMTDAVQNYFKHYIVVNNLQEFQQTVIHELIRVIQRASRGRAGAAA